MRKNIARIWFALVAACLLTVSAMADDAAEQSATESVELQDYKSPTCGCCGRWIEHIEGRGFTTRVEHPADLNGMKADWGIRPQYRSCHTAVTEDGLIFEGHIPASIMQRFLDERPAGAFGLAVPAMPVGSPGMESGDRFAPYQVLLLKASGEAEVYAEVRTREEQY